MSKKLILIRKLIVLYPEHIEWLSTIDNDSQYIRSLIDKDMSYPQDKVKK